MGIKEGIIHSSLWVFTLNSPFVVAVSILQEWIQSHSAVNTPLLPCFNNSSLLNLEGGEADIVHVSVVQNCFGRDHKVGKKKKSLALRVSLVFWEKGYAHFHWLTDWFFLINIWYICSMVTSMLYDHANTFTDRYRRKTQTTFSSSFTSTEAIQIIGYSVPMTLSFRP